MRKRKRVSQSRTEPYSEQQLAGLREHAQAQKQSTVDRLEAAIASLTAQHKLISARTIREECGLEYASFRRNPEALLLYQQHSTFLKQKRKRAKASHPDAPTPRDPLLAYRKTDLAVWAHQDVMPLPVYASVSRRCCAADTGAAPPGCGEKRRIPGHTLREWSWQRSACVGP